MAEETNKNKEANEVPSTVEQQAPSVAENNATSTSDPAATDIPTANAPVPEENLVENREAAKEKASPVASGSDESAFPATDGKPADETAAPTDKAPKPEAKKAEKSEAKPTEKNAAPAKGDKPAGGKPAAAKAAGDKPAAAKKEKKPSVEDKPFAEFMQQDYLPALQKAFAEQGVQGVDLAFKKQKFPVVGYEQDECWQIVGHWEKGSRQFNLYFPEEDIQGSKFFSCNEGSRPSTLEHFLGDERKMSLDLMIYGVMQRLNGQKWLVRN